MRVTRRGRALAFVSLALLLASVLFLDFVIDEGFVLLLIVVASEALWVKLAVRMAKTKIILRTEDPDRRVPKRVILYSGDESTERLRLEKRIGGRVEFESRINFLTIEPKAVRRAGGSMLEFRFRAPYAGEYSGKEVGIEVTGPLGLFSSKGAIPLERNYVVYPRLLWVAEATLMLLGKGVIGETPIEMPGVGTEYYEMRRYLAGDDVRKMNWKASSRLGELLVNEHMKEVGGSYLLILDARGPGFDACDRLATTFLLLANTLASGGVSFGVLVHDGEKITAVSSDESPRQSLGVALRIALSFTRVDSSQEFLELVPLRLPMKQLWKKSRFLKESGLFELPALGSAQLKGVVKSLDPWVTVSRYIRDRQTRRVILISGLFDQAEPVIELAWQSRHYLDTEFAVVNPCDPITSASEEEASRLRARYRRVSIAFSMAGVGYYHGEPLDLASSSLRLNGSM